MKKIFVFLIAVQTNLTIYSQKIQTPDVIYGQLFVDVQMNRIFPDNKTFVDCVPKRKPPAIVADYLKIKNNPAIKFSLSKFVEENFDMPPAPPAFNYIQLEKDVRIHIKNLWGNLKREQDKTIEGSSLLALPYPYIVPGGRFREIYYWDSYFTMLGLKESGETETMRHMLDNFKYLINTYGHIPNGNRSYYLSRSQPPFFALMVQLFCSATGNEELKNYVPAIEKEYNYWMNGHTTIKTGTASKKLVRLPDGSMLNRYCDELFIPRQESWADDIATASKSKRDNKKVYNHLRSAAESGWDFSSRWLAEENDLSTIETTDIIPIDLNCLLYNTEKMLSEFYDSHDNDKKSDFYKTKAEKRYKAIQKYCYNSNEKIYYDYNWRKKKQTGKFTPASFFPLWLLRTSVDEQNDNGAAAASKVKLTLLKDGGIVTSGISNKQQWDAPNGWAPLEWVVISALDNSDQKELATAIAKRWIKLNNDVYLRTGKLMEKYNVADTELEAGGGEYPGQDGFGWTNGVLLALIAKYGITE
ncbi:MAG: alpha,alpha-trehalase TreA [Bacteroidota bacterium]|nr:alpha,alpha-trehalase TreA [Bacteroidota bacterium]